MTPIFRTWTYKDAVDAHAARIERTVGKDGFAANLAFAEKGDHWQKGTTWPIGGLEPAVRERLLATVAPQFRPIDVIGEVLDNVANGLLDKEPDVTFVPITPLPTVDAEDTDGSAARAAAEQRQQAEIQEMVDRIFAWWDRKQFWEAVRQAARRSRWATFGLLRLWIARNALVTTQNTDGTTTTRMPTGLKFDDALDAVQLMAPTPETGFVASDPDTLEECGVFFFAVGKDAPSAKKGAELWFVDGEQTILRIVWEGDPARNTEFPVATGNRLPIAEMVADLLITDAVRRQQASLNYCETLLVRVIETAGFPERYTINAKSNGVWMLTPPLLGPPLEVQEISGKTWYLHQAPRPIGPMVTTELRGITGKSGTTGDDVVMTPSVTFKDPTDPEYLTKASDHCRMTILRECKQGHLANQSTAETSGLAYVQARAIFGKDLRATKSPLEGMVRDIIEAAIALGESMSSTSAGESFLARYRCVVTLHVDTGPVSPPEQAEYRAQNAAGLLARRSAMAASGVEDTAAEIEALDQDPIARANLWKARGEAMKALQDANAGFVGAARAIGLTVEEAQQLQASDLAGVGERP